MAERSKRRRASGPATRVPSQNGGSPVGSVGPNRDDVGTVSRTATSLATAAPTNSVDDAIVSTAPMISPSAKRRRRSAAAPRSRRLMPRPLNRLVAARAMNHG